MRINSGLYKGRKLILEGKGEIRPSLSRVRKMVFDTLTPLLVNHPYINKEKMNFLDIFAGTGSYGFEALSIFGGNCTFMEIEKSFCDSIREFGKKIGLKDRIAVYRGNALVLLNKLVLQESQEKHEEVTIPPQVNTQYSYDVVFLDPPYDKEFLITKAIKKLVNNGNVGDHSYIVVETSCYKKLNFLPTYVNIIKEKTTANTRILILQLVNHPNLQELSKE
jgi:16S rRNA (guanine966-N2)-methyltransferase